MPQLNQNITLQAGDDVELDFSLKESNGTTPLDITGATVNWALASVYDPDTALITKSTSVPGQITVTNAAGGIGSIYLVPNDTKDLGGQPYRHEMEVVGGGSSVTVFIGSATITKTIQN